MSRGGRAGGGGRGGPSLTGGQALPFELDGELIDACENSDPATDSEKELFPDIADFVMAAPVTDAERREVQIFREHRARMREGPFWTGSKEQWVEVDGVGRSGEGGGVGGFEATGGYGRKFVRRAWRMADLSKFKIDPQFHAKEVWPILGVRKDGVGVEDTTTSALPNKRRKLGLSKKSTTDKLARFDEGYEEPSSDAEADADAEADEEGSDDGEKEEGEKDENGFDRELQDDEFDEDDDDADNDYNAELYFDGGEEDFEEQGGEEYGDEG